MDQRSDQKKRPDEADQGPEEARGARETQQVPECPEVLETNDGTPLERGGSLQPRAQPAGPEEVDEASDESFPASDAPSFTPIKAA